MSALTVHRGDELELQRASAAALAALPNMSPRRLTGLLDAWEPCEAWRRVATGRASDLTSDARVAALIGSNGVDQRVVCSTWARAAAGLDLASVLQRHRDAGIDVLLRSDARYPEALRHDIEPPAVLFSSGDLSALDHGPRVAIVGTRRCTGLGAGFARELGRELAAAGAVVVSGLALGIDGAAHRGVLDTLRAGAAGPPVGVVGCGIDIVYPARHHDLWHEVAERGLLLSEVPAGLRPTGWRFPARNRIIAALADIVVVVESHQRGGSLLTVDEAQRRDVPVMAVPGSVRSPSAGGTNALIADGCHPVCDAGDVLVALGLSTASLGARADSGPAPDPTSRAVLDAFDWEPATLDHLAVRSGFALPELSLALERLQSQGLVTLDGGWYERVASR